MGWRAPGSKGHDPYQGLDTDRGRIFLETFHDVDRGNHSARRGPAGG